MTRFSRMVACAALLSFGAVAGAPGQIPTPDAAQGVGLAASRQGLEDRAQQLELASRSGTLSQDARTDAAREAMRIRTRLAAGDFAPGERILLAVEGEKDLTDTFTVARGPVLPLPGVGDVPLEGVLRSELQSYLTRRLGQTLRDPVLRAQALVRVSVQGSVARPGFYAVPADALLSAALMAAGGTTAEADLRKLRIERDGHSVWEGRALARAIAEGRTLDDAGLVAGDQYVVPKRGGTSAGDVLRFSVFLLTIPVTVYSLTRIF